MAAVCTSDESQTVSQNELTILIHIIQCCFSLFYQFKSKIDVFASINKSLKVVNSDFPKDNEDNHELVAVVIDVVIVVSLVIVIGVIAFVVTV